MQEEITKEIIIEDKNKQPVLKIIYKNVGDKKLFEIFLTDETGEKEIMLTPTNLSKDHLVSLVVILIDKIYKDAK